MFVYSYQEIDRPFAEVEGSVLGLLESLDELGSAAYRHGEAIRAQLEIGGEYIAKTVRVHAAFPRRGSDQTSVPITWEATGAPGLFPKLEGDLVIASLAPHLTQIALRGSYTPPFGAVGRALDRSLLHRIAEASVRSFVERLARAIEDERAQFVPRLRTAVGGGHGDHPAG
jgi:hypothetical protein